LATLDSLNISTAATTAAASSGVLLWSILIDGSGMFEAG
jgi:hypothetical protein